LPPGRTPSAGSGGPFKGLFDFCRRVDLKRVNRKVLECLIKAGAFDLTGVPRKRMFDSVDRALERGQAEQRDRAVGQASLFGALSPAKAGPSLDAEDYLKGDEWPEKERLRLEKESIGFYITGHPLEQYAREVERYARPCSRVQGMRKDEKVTLAGILVGLREKTTQSGKKMAWVTLEDLTGSVDLVLFPPKDGSKPVMVDGKWQKGQPRPGYQDWEPLVKGDEPVMVKGAVQFNSRDEENPKAEVIVESIESLAAVRAQRAKRLEIRLPIALVTEEKLVELRKICHAHPGSVGLALQLLLPQLSEVTVASTALKVSPDDELFGEIEKLFGEKVAEIA